MADGVSLSLFAFVGCLNTMGRNQAQATARVSVEANRTIIREFWVAYRLLEESFWRWSCS